ncbi:MAG: quinone-dependent dihydroorotate dehydrogenase [Planctomycetaceae bacterium]|nr:quinone-dependent dihydroorotate dehydrogenase [Planctomycetaceae bacterium]
MFWRYLARPLLFSLPAETVHHFSMGMFHASMFPPISSVMGRLTRVRDPRLRSRVWGIDFDNPVGLAAGFDKQAAWFNSLRHLGFSHIEVGTITGVGQAGNPKPRLFRGPDDQALINRMGFNNVGAEQAAAALAATSIKPVVGINIGKTKLVDVEHAVGDYLKSFRLLHPFARYFTVNVSSPNTPGLRTLQDRGPLKELLVELMKENARLANANGVTPRPVLLKIAPDLNADQVEDIAALAKEIEIDGIIATNTTISRSDLSTSAARIQEIGNGGLSGKPLTQVSRNMVRELYEKTERTIPLIGVGGIMNGQDAWNMIGSGASLIQVYTGFIYGGPLFVKQLNRFISQQLADNELADLSQAVGMNV